MGCNLRHQTGEQGVMQDTVLLLVSLADCKEKCKALLASQGLVQLLQVANVPDSIPATSKRGLMKALVLLGSAQEDKATREAYWGQVLTPLEARYQEIVGRDNLKAIYMDAKVRGAVVDVLESLTGVVQGCAVSTVHQVFGWLRPTLVSMVHLLNLYHNYSNIVELILELFCETAKRILCYFTPSDSGETVEEVVTAADVCLLGLNIIMPLMSAELLKFPNLCLQYFKTITFVCEIYPEKITSLDPGLQKNLVASLELGLAGLGVDAVFTLCCDFIQVLGCHMIRQKAQASPIYEPLRPFLKLLMDLILSQNINSELVPHSSATLCVLICLFQDTYHQLVEALIASQADESSRTRLTEAFTQLTANIPLSAERIHRIRFRDSFDRFIVNVRGFLFVK